MMTEPTGWTRAALAALADMSSGTPFPVGCALLRSTVLAAVNTARRDANEPEWNIGHSTFNRWLVRQTERGYLTTLVTDEVRYIVSDKARRFVNNPVHLLVSESFRDWLVGFLDGAGTLQNTTNPTDAELRAAVRSLAQRSAS